MSVMGPLDVAQIKQELRIDTTSVDLQLHII